jgi:hypothetical protein
MDKFPERIRASLKQPQLLYVKRHGEALQPPAYELSGGTPATPTGRILVRFKDAAALQASRKEIEAAGYKIEELLSYAPQAAWVRAASGDTAESLTRIAMLESLNGVEEIEPQMLRPRALK